MKNKTKILTLLTMFALATVGRADSNTKNFTSLGGGYYIGQTSFPFGDSIEITSVERDGDRLMVRGHYELVSADRAELDLFTTTQTATLVPTDPKQLMKISKGHGEFELVHPNVVPGLNHVTMYAESDKGTSHPFAGIYFGTKEEAEAESALDLGYYRNTSATSASTETNAHGGDGFMSEANRALFEYLGEAVAPAANTDARYTVEGSSNAVRQAEQKAGITVKRVRIDDSEFPFIIGVVCQGGDAIKLKAELKKLAGYEYGGGIGNDKNSDGSDSCNVFNMIPYRAFPQAASERIYHRLWLREQVFHDKVSREAR